MHGVWLDFMDTQSLEVLIGGQDIEGICITINEHPYTRRYECPYELKNNVKTYKRYFSLFLFLHSDLWQLKILRQRLAGTRSRKGRASLSNLVAHGDY